MSANRWPQVWRGHRPTRGAPGVLAHLLRADGFHELGGVAPEAWLEFATGLGERFGLGHGDSIFDVGCGSGALMFPFYGKVLRVGGIDYAPRQIRRAQRFMPEGDFAVGEAAELSLTPAWDVVVAHSVFQYFPSDDYAETVLRRMAAKATRGLAILDLPDLAFEEEDQARRRATLGEAEYTRRYDGLPLRYYDREWFAAILGRLGWDCGFAPQDIPGYAHAGFRYHVLALKQPERAISI